jgi:hypothetical protein
VFIADGEYVSTTKPTAGNDPKLLNNIVLQLVFGALANCSDEKNPTQCDLPAQIAPIVNVLDAQYSGQVLGLLGTVISPLVQVTKSFTAVGQYFEDGDVVAAINELINIPANMTNAFLNGGGYLDLTAIAEQFLPLEPGTLDRIGVNLGGLLNAVPFDGSLQDPDNPPTQYSGGTGFDGIAAEASGVVFPGLPVGWAGSVIGLGQFLGEQLVVTPPAPPPVAAEPEAAKLAAPADISAVTEAPVEEAAPAVVDVPAEESAPAAVEVVAEDPAPAVAEVVAEDPAPAVEELAEVEAAVEAVEASASEPADAVTPAAEDSGPEAAADSDKSADDTDRSGGSDRRGAS